MSRFLYTILSNALLKWKFQTAFSWLMAAAEPGQTCLLCLRGLLWWCEFMQKCNIQIAFDQELECRLILLLQGSSIWNYEFYNKTEQKRMKFSNETKITNVLFECFREWTESEREFESRLEWESIPMKRKWNGAKSTNESK